MAAASATVAGPQLATATHAPSAGTLTDALPEALPAALPAAMPAVLPAVVADALSPDFEMRVARYEMALEVLPWGVMVADADGGVVFANASTARLLHLDELQPGQPVTEIFPDAGRITTGLSRCREIAGTESAAVEVFFQSPALWVELEPLHDPSFGYLGVVAVIRNKGQEQGTVETEVMLALADALKSPMTSILGYSDLLARGSGLSQDQLDRYLQRIDANLARMQVNLENFLTVLDLNGRRKAAPVAIGVAQALKAATERARPQLAEKGLSANLAAPEDLPLASADAGALEQILDNLIAHSAQRSPQGGDIALTAELREERGSGKAIVITVADRGQPLAAPADGVLELDDTPTVNVGLSVVKLLADACGGRAWAESGTSGARFLVRLPVRR
jgi:signal transduction histidine kinase